MVQHLMLPTRKISVPQSTVVMPPVKVSQRDNAPYLQFQLWEMARDKHFMQLEYEREVHENEVLGHWYESFLFLKYRKHYPSRQAAAETFYYNHNQPDVLNSEQTRIDSHAVIGEYNHYPISIADMSPMDKDVWCAYTGLSESDLLARVA